MPKHKINKIFSPHVYFKMVQSLLLRCMENRLKFHESLVNLFRKSILTVMLLFL